MTKNKAFWGLWIMLTLFIIWFFWVIGELESVSFGKSVILAVTCLATAYPIHRYVKANTDYDED